MLQVIIDGFSALVDFFITVFATVLDFIIGLAALPFIGPINIILNIILSIICKTADIAVNAILAILTYDQFGQKTLFEVAFQPEQSYLVMRSFSIGLLMAIFLFQLIRTMVATPDDVTDDPIGLTARTLVAATLIFASRTMISYAFQVTGMFYRAITNGANLRISFDSFCTTAQDFMKNDLPTLGIRAQLLTLIALIFLIIMSFALAKKVVSYVAELVLRFTIVGVMFLMAPLAATLYASKSTRNSFNAWVRMVASQMLLLVLGVFFIRLFCDAFNEFSNTFRVLRYDFNVNRVSALLIWTFMAYSILSVGAKVDSLLKSLGLNAAECGSNVTAALVSEAKMLTIGIVAAAAYGAGIATGEIEPGPVMQGASRLLGGTVWAGKTVARRVFGIDTKQGNTSRIGAGPITVDEINRAVPPVVTKPGPFSKGNTKTAKHNLSQRAGQNICQNMRGLPQHIRNRFDPTAFSIQGGLLRGATYVNKNGMRTQVALVPIASDCNRQKYDTPTAPNANEAYTKLVDKEELRAKYPGGREVLIGGQAYMMYAIGDEARTMMVANPQMKKEMNELAAQTGDYIEQLKDVNGEQTGIWQQIVYNSDGSLTKRYWIPTSRYKVDDSLTPLYVTIGGMTYAQYDMDYGLSPMNALKGALAPEAFEHWSEAERQEWFKHCFPVYQDQTVKNVQFENGVYAADINGVRTLTFSPLEYGLRDGYVASENIRNIATMTGTQYVSVSVPKPNYGGVADANWLPLQTGARVNEESMAVVGPVEAAEGPRVEELTQGIPTATAHKEPGEQVQSALLEEGPIKSESMYESHEQSGDRPQQTTQGQTWGPHQETGQSKDDQQDTQKKAGPMLSDFERHILFVRLHDEFMTPELDISIVPSEDAESFDAIVKDSMDDDDDNELPKRRRKGKSSGKTNMTTADEKVNLAPILKDALRKRRKNE